MAWRRLLCVIPPLMLSPVQGFIAPAVPAAASSVHETQCRASPLTAAVDFLKKGPAAVKDDVTVTFLESNSWLWQVAGVNLLVDPVMYTLDFGVPSLIQGKKTVVDGDLALKQLSPDIDWMLISQGFDDHCHPTTLAKAVNLLPSDTKVIAPPSAKAVLEQFFPSNRVVYLSPGQSTVIGKRGSKDAKITVVATSGDTLGPPWQAPENGYVLQFEGKKYRSLYYEPHCRFNAEEFEKLGLSADVVITPIIEQQILGLYPLVAGQATAVELAKALQAKVVVPMNNGELDLSGSSWAFQNLIKKVGTLDEFRALLSDGLPSTTISEAPPGVSVAVA